jgi:hypothetical protein
MTTIAPLFNNNNKNVLLVEWCLIGLLLLKNRGCVESYVQYAM